MSTNNVEPTDASRHGASAWAGMDQDSATVSLLSIVTRRNCMQDLSSCSGGDELTRARHSHHLYLVNLAYQYLVNLAYQMLGDVGAGDHTRA